MRSQKPTSSVSRFDQRVENYIAYRPRYPAAVGEFMQDKLGLHAASVIADVGSGTGILSELLLKIGCTVFAVEPNAEMRAGAERLLQRYPRFISVNGTAEATTLGDAKVDFVTAGQAFHWFDAYAARREFKRILKPSGWIVLLWNVRRLNTTPFLQAYEQLLREFGTDYSQVNCEQLPEEHIADFFRGEYCLRSFDNFQVLDYEELRGRLLSASYVPLAGHPGYEPMLARLRELFDEHRRDGRVRIEYDARVYYGRLP